MISFPHYVQRFIFFFAFTALPTFLAFDMGDILNPSNLSMSSLPNLTSQPNFSRDDHSNVPNLFLGDFRNLPNFHIQPSLYMGDLPYQSILPPHDLPNHTSTHALNLSEASKYYVVDTATGALVHKTSLYADIFISCIVFFVLLLTLSLVVVQCCRTPRIPHDEFLLMSIGPVPAAMAMVPPNHVPPPSYGTYLSPYNRDKRTPYCSTSPPTNPPVYETFPRVQPSQPDRKMTLTDTRSTPSEKKGTSEKHEVVSSVGKIAEGKVLLNSSGKTRFMKMGTRDVELHSDSTEEETFFEIDQMPCTVKSTEKLNNKRRRSKLASETNKPDTKSCSSEEEVYFDADRSSEEGEVFNRNTDKAK